MPAPANYDDFAARVLRECSNSAQPKKIRIGPEDGSLRDVIEAALREYSDDRPDEGKASLSGNGSTFEFTLNTLISDWTTKWSRVLRLRLVSTDASERREAPLAEGQDFEVLITTDIPSKDVLRILDITPGTTEKLDVYYSRIHTLTDTATSVPSGDMDALINLACSNLFLLYAERATSAVDIETGESNRLSGLDREYSDRAESRRARYNTHIFGNAEGKLGAVGAHAVWYPRPGSEPITHSINRRGTR